MSGFAEAVQQWKEDSAMCCFHMIEPQDGDGALIEVDEVCFVGGPGLVPQELQYLEGPVFHIEPEAYFFAMKGGKLIGPDEWFAAMSKAHLEAFDVEGKALLNRLRGLYLDEGRDYPSVVYTALCLSDDRFGDAITVQDFGPLPKPWMADMTGADAAFDRFVARVAARGSAYDYLMES